MGWILPAHVFVLDNDWLEGDTMATYHEFDKYMRAQFKQGPTRAVGLELERCLIDSSGQLVPRSEVIIQAMRQPWTTEEPARWQVEVKTDPHRNVHAVLNQMAERMRAQDQYAQRFLGCMLQAHPVVCNGKPPHHIYPSDECVQIAAILKKRGSLEAALAVASLQVNLSFDSPAAAIAGYNRLAMHVPLLLQAGDFSGGMRQRLYGKAVPAPMPRLFDSGYQLWQEMQRCGVENPSKLHTFVVLKPGWVVEIRTFDATDDLLQMRQLIELAQMIAHG